MTFTRLRSVSKGVVALVAMAALLGTLALAATAGAQERRELTRSDCERGGITLNGKLLSRSECLKRVGQRGTFADTGFAAWAIGAAGVFCLGGAMVLTVRRRRTSAAALS